MAPTDAERLVADAEDAFAQYRRAVAPLFDYLRARARVGFTAAQFRLYRDNYFYRTNTTAAVVARIAYLAAARRDRVTLATAAKNLFEETGEGIPDRSHPLLLEQSHNAVAGQVFGLPPLGLDAADESPLLLAEARDYRERQRRLVEEGDYLTALGASYTQETMATDMLRGFYDTLFVPYRERLAGTFALVSMYFTVHLDGVEEEHGRHAREAVCRACRTDADRQSAFAGIRGFLDAQRNLWTALHRALVAEERTGPVVPVGGR